MQLKCANSKPDLLAGTHRGSPFAASWGTTLFCSHPILVQATSSVFVLPKKKHVSFAPKRPDANPYLLRKPNLTWNINPYSKGQKKIQASPLLVSYILNLKQGGYDNKFESA